MPKTEMYEVHLITIVKDIDESALETVPLNAIRPRLGEARTFYGLHPIQPMLTYWERGDEETVVNHAHETAAKVGDVIRIKIEALPHSIPDLDKSKPIDKDKYWEFHAKLSGKDWDECAKVCVRHGVHLFWNAAKPDQTPIINLRRYGVSYEDACKDLDALLYDLEMSKIKTSEIHHEYGVLDTAPELDEGWLYAHGADKSDFMTEIPSSR